MAETETLNNPVTTTVEAVTAPVVETPLIVQTAVETPPVASVEAVKAPAEVTETAKVETIAETVLAEALDKDSKPVVEQPKVEQAKEVVTTETQDKTTEGQSEEPAPPPTYDPFTVPEGITLDADRVGKFTEILADLEITGKVPHEFAQQFGQKAVDFHVQEVQKAAEDITKLYQTTWERQKTEWKDAFLKDPEIGGNRFQTTVDAARTFIRTHGGTTEQQTEFRNLMETSGLGNHPAVIRLLANAGTAMVEGKQLAASKPVSQPKSKVNTLYGGGSSN